MHHAKYLRAALTPIFAMALAPALAQSQPVSYSQSGGQMAAAIAPDCFDAAASYHGVNVWLLRAIAKHESGGKAGARGLNTNRSEDWGMMQINTQHLPKLASYGVHHAQLWDGCTSVFVGAWILRDSINRFGNTWTAVGAYNSSIPGRRIWYANQIKAVLANWHRQGLLPPGH